MCLARDEDSIILGLFSEARLATMTLNTITPRFPGMAMELDKKVSINHAHFLARPLTSGPRPRKSSLRVPRAHPKRGA